ncbi:hypothetical protein [Paracoccus jeotgali]|uniref:Uncharacterized protein n=1 Tax=Paracoccus jeotgali TaxID=2065379 RepID=A0A2K9MD15_9RHOB|nr:hypothetical protein [Paracoccus jeotgali]AUM72926.1 hypothetical protein CYR75_00140 [Paracoccus jeotgali]
MFESLLPHADFMPRIQQHGPHRWAEETIGHNRVVGRVYALRVTLCGYGFCEDLGDEAAELVFTVCAYDALDPEAEEEVFYSGSETKQHFSDKPFRKKVIKLIATLGCHLVEDVKPKRLIFVTKFPALPLAAAPKYELLCEKILALGYTCSKYETTDRRQLWDMRRT